MLGKAASRNFETILKAFKALDLDPRDGLRGVESEGKSLEFEVAAKRIKTARQHLELEAIEEEVERKQTILELLS